MLAHERTGGLLMRLLFALALLLGAHTAVAEERIGLQAIIGQSDAEYWESRTPIGGWESRACDNGCMMLLDGQPVTLVSATAKSSDELGVTVEATFSCSDCGELKKKFKVTYTVPFVQYGRLFLKAKVRLPDQGEVSFVRDIPLPVIGHWIAQATE